MTTPDDRLSELELEIDRMSTPEVASAVELTRREGVRFARHFGTPVPILRTSVRLRFHGPGVPDHDLRGSTAADVIGRFSEAVRAAGQHFNSVGPGVFELYLSPTVATGSTVLELFGAPLDRSGAGGDTLDDEILDSPVDAAIGELFRVLDTVTDGLPSTQQDPAIDGVLGKHLFALAQDLIKGDIDLDIDWQRPRGTSRQTALPLTKSRTLRDMLDRETTTNVTRQGRGELVSVSTDGRITLRLDGTKRAIPIAAPNFAADELRALWAHDVLASWSEKTVSHPQRDTSTVTNELLSIRLAPEQPVQGELSDGE